MAYLLEGKETERLLFRKLVQEDFQEWLPFHQDSRSSEYWTGESSDATTACKMWFESTLYRYQNNFGGMNMLIEKNKKVIIGQCGLLIQIVDGVQEMEIGYSILPSYWNQGYATEAARKCMEHAFQNQLSKSLISIIHVENTASQKVAENVGMSLDKTTLYKDNPVYIFRINEP